MSVTLTVSYRDSLNQTQEGLQHSRRCTELMGEEKKFKTRKSVGYQGQDEALVSLETILFLAVGEAGAISAAARAENEGNHRELPVIGRAGGWLIVRPPAVATKWFYALSAPVLCPLL